MPDAVSFTVHVYYKLAKGETGLTHAQTVRIPASAVLDFALDHLPEGAVTVSHDETGDITTTVVDWSKVPEHTRRPNLLARRR